MPEEKMPDSYYQQLENQLVSKDSELVRANQGMVSSMFSGQQEPNLIEFQLELNDIIERIEMLLRGKVLTTDTEGNTTYEEPKDDDLKPFNEFGVQLLMSIVTSYVNRNTILSNYKEERIYKILYDLGWEIADQIYLNYEKMGMNTPDKMKRYPMIFTQIMHMIESVYMRALHGGERDSLRSARMVTQNVVSGGGQQMYPNYGMKKKRFSIINPFSWGK